MHLSYGKRRVGGCRRTEMAVLSLIVMVSALRDKST